MSATAASPTTGAGEGPAAAFTSVLNAAGGSAASRLDEQVSRWTDRLNGVSPTGTAESAVVSGVDAKLHGRNPFWAAVKATWKEGSATVRAAVVTAVVATILMLLVSPVLLLVFLLSLLVIAAVMRARQQS